MNGELDQWIRALVVAGFEAGGSSLEQTLEMCLAIKESRTAVPDYGFEWAVETLFASVLLRRQADLGIREIRINQRADNQSKRRYDLSFQSGEQHVIIEIKTTTEGSPHWTKSDVIKPYPQGSTVYFLTVSYPFDGQMPTALDGAIFVAEGLVAENFRYSLFRKETLNDAGEPIH